MKPQIWYCEVCGTLGCLMVKDREDVMSVVMRQGEQHGAASGMCPVRGMGLRSIVIENCKKDFTLTTSKRYEVVEGRIGT